MLPLTSTSAIFDSLIAQINEGREGSKEGKFPSGGMVEAQSAPPPFVGNIVQAKQAEKLWGVVFDGLRTCFHATRALVYLCHLDMVKMSLFDPYPSDGDNVLWSDESSSSTARYARLVPPPPSSHEICSDSMGVVGGCGYGVVIGGCGYGCTYRCTIVKCWV